MEGAANAWYSANSDLLFRSISGHFSARRLTPLRVFMTKTREWDGGGNCYYITAF